MPRRVKETLACLAVGTSVRTVTPQLTSQRGSGAPREIPGAAAICCRYSGIPVYCNLLQKAGRNARSDPKRP